MNHFQPIPLDLCHPSHVKLVKLTQIPRYSHRNLMTQRIPEKEPASKLGGKSAPITKQKGAVLPDQTDF